MTLWLNAKKAIGKNILEPEYFMKTRGLFYENLASFYVPTNQNLESKLISLADESNDNVNKMNVDKMIVDKMIVDENNVDNVDNKIKKDVKIKTNKKLRTKKTAIKKTAIKKTAIKKTKKKI